MSTHQPDDQQKPGPKGHAVATEDPPKKDEQEESEALDEALDDSFPASDPPSQTAKTSKP